MGLFDFLSGLFGGDETDEPRSTDGGASDDADDGDGESKDIREYGPADFREEAESFAADKADQNFDFTVESLERLDDYAASQTEMLGALGQEMDGENAVLGQLRNGYVLWWGSYFGEVLVRQFDAEWVTEGDTVSVQVPTAMQSIEILVLDAAMAAIEDEPQFAATARDLRTDIADAESAAGTDAPAPETVLDSLDLDPSLDLESAHSRAVEAFRSAGYQVSEGDIIDSIPDRAAQDCTKLFTFNRGRKMHIGVVYRGEWDDRDTNGVVALVSNLRGDDETAGVHVVSATDPPDSVSYLSGTHPRGAFATAALVAVQTGAPFDADSVRDYAELGQELLAEHLDVTIGSVDASELERIDDIILSQLRTVPETHPQEGYKPQEALILLGALAGEVMRQALEASYPVETAWTDDEDIASTGVALRVRATETGEAATVNPVGKALKQFENGNEDSIAFMYETVQRIVEDDLL